jgi:hypothetical protein
MKEEIERRIMAKEEKIKLLNMKLDESKKALKSLTMDEFEIEEYLIRTASKRISIRNEICQLQVEVYELMQILKQNK